MHQNLTGRVFDILVNDVVVTANVNLYATAMNTLYKPIEIVYNKTIDAAYGAINITLSKSALSLASPIWNALEVYSIHAKQAGTFASDGTYFSFSS